MNKSVFYIIIGLIISSASVAVLFKKQEQPVNFSERVKLSLRDAGNQLLLANEDSTSLVLPVKALEPHKFQLSFQENLRIQPDSLLAAVKRSFKKTNLPSQYRVAVLECVDKEVAYSYEIMGLGANDIIPCKGRLLPKSCYAIEVRFTNKEVNSTSEKLMYSGFIGVGLILFIMGLIPLKSTVKYTGSVAQVAHEANALGSFFFYPEQNKLLKEGQEIRLSVKECELLSIFVEKPNEVIKREELSKKVWEDKGVVVGRSLDTYISKLRKKLKPDSSLKLTNIHGVGYKLEIEE